MGIGNVLVADVIVLTTTMKMRIIIMKIIEVSCCGECPYLEDFDQCLELKYKEVDRDIIDKDCPLQDANDVSSLSETLLAVLFNKEKEAK